MAFTMKNPSVVLYGPEDIRVVDMPIPKPKEGEVLIKIHSVGICGTDKHLLETGRNGEYVISRPYTLGHEASGVVMKLGESVTQLKEGDAVALDNHLSCEVCWACKTDQYNFCKAVMINGIPNTDGFLAKYVVQKAKYCYRLPVGFPIEHGALVEPLTIAVYACRRANIKPTNKVLVTGAGPIGIAAAMVAKAMGAAEVCITDINKRRLDLAHKLGVTYTVLCDTADTEVLRQRIEEKFGQKPDISIECSGAQAAMELSCITTEWFGVVVLVGLGRASFEIPIEIVVLRGISLLGIGIRTHDTFEAAIQFASTGAVDLGALISHRFSIEDALEAFNLICHCAGENMKILIHFP